VRADLWIVRPPFRPHSAGINMFPVGWRDSAGAVLSACRRAESCVDPKLRLDERQIQTGAHFLLLSAAELGQLSAGSLNQAKRRHPKVAPTSPIANSVPNSVSSSRQAPCSQRPAWRPPKDIKPAHLLSFVPLQQSTAAVQLSVSPVALNSGRQCAEPEPSLTSRPATQLACQLAGRLNQLANWPANRQTLDSDKRNMAI